MAKIFITDNDLERDPGLETSILIILFTDQRADNSDVLPDNSGDKRGWWGDFNESVKIGSKLWLIGKSAMTPDLPNKIEQYCNNALSVLVDDGVAQNVYTTATREDMDNILIEIEIIQPDGTQKFFKYAVNWEFQILKRG